MIHLSEIRYTYPKGGAEAIRGISLDVSMGETLFVLGHNGAGKSTMLRLFNGLLKPGSGTVTVDGTDTREVRPAQLSRTVGLVFQNPDAQLFRDRVSEEVSFGAENGSGDDDATERHERAMALLDLESVADHNPYDLTLSWRKRVAIASVVAMGTPVLVLDEPTGGQDADGTRVLTDLISDTRRRGHGCVVVTHDVDLAFDCADRVVVLRDGKIHLEGSPMSVLGDPLLHLAGVEPSTMHQISGGIGLDPPARGVDELEEYLEGAGGRTP
ncbi:MAG: ABC transporter ATP-binding protein [bacterium]|nr:ABC transporter ATP-binding protein [bacterium]